MKTPYAKRSSKIQLTLILLLSLGLGLRASGSAYAQAAASQPGPGVGERSTPINSVPEKRVQEEDENAVYRHSPSVVKLGSMVGLSANQAATAFEVLNFLILAIGLGYVASKLLPGKFRDRSSAIQKHLVDARTATEEASARLNAVETRLSKLDAEIAGMREHVEADTARDEQRVKAAIEEETAKILAAADSEIQSATATARRELQRHAAELAIDQAARRLVITAETDRLLVQGFAQRLIGDKGGQN